MTACTSCNKGRVNHIVKGAYLAVLMIREPDQYLCCMCHVAQERSGVFTHFKCLLRSPVTFFLVGVGVFLVLRWAFKR